jgi:hypothetical protein
MAKCGDTILRMLCRVDGHGVPVFPDTDTVAAVYRVSLTLTGPFSNGPYAESHRSSRGRV